VDYVAVNHWPTAVETIRLLRPDVYCKGGEFRHMAGEIPPGLQAELEVSAEVGTRVEFTDDNLFSSSKLINDYLHVFPPETEAWLKAFRGRRSGDEVIEYLERSARLKALVIGEAIIDEYVFCDGLGKSSKDPILAFQHRSTEAYAGGSLAVANHLAGFCEQVGLITLLGETERREDLVSQTLHSNVRPLFITRRGAPTIHKRRFVDTHTGARVFELYIMRDEPLDPDDRTRLVQALKDEISKYDVVVVSDYGHGMLSQDVITLLCKEARFLAVNTQANAGNRGFNTISKYPRADYVCLAGHEVALETRMRHADWRDLLLEVTRRIDCPRFTMTQGRDGSLHYALDCGFTEVPALATHVTDRVGAGDAVLAVTSLMVAQNAPWDVVGFIGNVAGAQMVAELGNRVAVSKDSIARHVISLMK
jgi:rfaE bifunctional protein kinase chain/domain